ncbi:MAG TPA: hypothetical protein VM120_04100 [Bryobacteraceae bacterium]|nr:hypothetical protein [Bryobacteraceae bacterium]
MHCVLIPALMFCLGLGAAVPGQNEDPALNKALNDRIAEYLTSRKKAVQGIPALKAKSTPEQIQARRLAIVPAIRKERANARQGEVLTKEIEERIRQIIRSEMRGKEGVPAKATAKQGNPATDGPVTFPVKVNGSYPDSAPLSSVPSTLLLRLPQLPKELDFRFVGRRLILRDVEASLIVDYILNATP